MKRSKTIFRTVLLLLFIAYSGNYAFIKTEGRKLIKVRVEHQKYTLNERMQSQQEEIKSFPAAKGDDLEMRVSPGDVSLFAWDKNEVRIMVKGIDKDDLENLEMEKQGNKIIVRYNSEWNWSGDVKFEVSFPSEFNLDVRTTGGDIKLEGDIKGEVKLSTNGGEISTGNISGETYLNTMGGDIEVKDIKGEITIKTQGGDITAGSLDGNSANVKTMGGDIVIQKAGGKADIQTFGGDIEIGVLDGESRVETFGGTISVKEGKKDLELSTFGGNIIVGSSAGSVNAETKGGNIKVKNAASAIDIRTQAGRIEIELTGDNLKGGKVINENGEIILTLPSDARVTVIAEINVPARWKSDDDEFRIVSDFPVSDSDKTATNGTVSGTYEINGGGEKLILKTKFDNIYIKKK